MAVDFSGVEQGHDASARRILVKNTGCMCTGTTEAFYAVKAAYDEQSGDMDMLTCCGCGYVEAYVHAEVPRELLDAIEREGVPPSCRPFEHAGACPDGFVPFQYLVLHPDGKSHCMNAASFPVAVTAARGYAGQWVRDAAGEELQQHQHGKHTMWETRLVGVDASGVSCIELQAVWEMSTREVYDAVRSGSWPPSAPVLEAGQ